VKCYNVKPTNRSTKVKCIFSEGSVTVLEVNSVNGNRRMQAAAAIGQYAISLNLRTPLLITLVGRSNSVAGGSVV